MSLKFILKTFKYIMFLKSWNHNSHQVLSNKFSFFGVCFKVLNLGNEMVGHSGLHCLFDLRDGLYLSNI